MAASPLRIRRTGFALLIALGLGMGLAPRPAAAADDIRATRPDPAGGPTVITFRAYLIDFLGVNDAAQSFQADIFVVLSWIDPRLAHRGPEPRRMALDDVWYPRIVTVNARDLDSTLPREILVSPEGKVAFQQRVQGTFTTRVDLRDFPLDSQTFRFHLVSPEDPAGDLRFEVDPVHGLGRAPVFSAGAWHFGDLVAEPGVFRVTPDAPGRPQLVIELHGKRHIRYYVVQLLLPLFAVVIMAWAPFWIDPTVVPARLGIPITTMLTLIAFRFMLGNLVPKLSYLTRLDLLLLGSTALVAASMIYMALSGRMVSLGREERMRRIDRVARVAFPLLFLVVLALAKFS